MRGRHAATLICLVDDVIVNEGAGLVELERCAEVGQGNVFDWNCCSERVADMRHESPEPLPPATDASTASENSSDRHDAPARVRRWARLEAVASSMCGRSVAKLSLRVMR